MKKKYTAVLASAAALALMLSACTGDTGSSQSVGSGSADPAVSSSVSSGVTSTDGSQQEELGDPVNSMVFMHGADFTGMTVERNENYDNGTYWYEDLTEDKMVRIVNRSFPTDPAWLEAIENTDAPWENVIWAAIDAEAYDIWGEGVGDETASKGDYPTYYAQWSTGRNEDTRCSHGVMVIDNNYTYVYYLSTPIDNYDEMNSTFIDILGQVQLEEVKE